MSEARSPGEVYLVLIPWCGAMSQEVQKRNLTPKWEEDKWLLVQEPKTQILRAQVFDHDTVNLKVRSCRACRQ